MKPLVTIRLMIMMFLQFFLWGSWYVTAPRFLGPVGFEGTDIGWTYSVGPIAGIISPFFLGMIADRFFSTERVLAVMHLAGGAFMFLAASMLGQSEVSPALVNLVFFAHMLCFFPTLALTNTLALHNMTKPETEFPAIRVFGTIGWIIAGVILAFTGWGASINQFYLAGGCGIALGLFSFFLPHTPPPSAGKKVTFGQLAGVDAFGLFRNPSFLAFMVSSFLICIPLAFYYQLAERTVAQVGLVYPPAKMTFGQISEVFFMLLMPFFFARLGVKWMLFVGMLAWVVRYGLFAWAAPHPDEFSMMWMVLIGVMLHGICYDFFFVTGQIYTDKVAHKEIRGQAQGLLVLFTLGVGMMIGAQVGGLVEKRFTPPTKGRMEAEAKAFGDAAKEYTTQFDEWLEDGGDARLEAFDAAWKEFEASEPATNFVLKMFTVRTKPDPYVTLFNQDADRLLQSTRDEADKLSDQMKNLDPDSADMKKLEGEMESIREQQVEILVRRMDDQAQGLFRDDGGMYFKPDLREGILLKNRANWLGRYRDQRNLLALREMNWKMIWVIPCVFAGVVMLVFTAIFKDDSSRDSKTKEGLAAEADPQGDANIDGSI